MPNIAYSGTLYEIHVFLLGILPQLLKKSNFVFLFYRGEYNDCLKYDENGFIKLYMANKKLKPTITNKHWGSLAMGYLKVAEQGFLFLQKQENIGRTKISKGTRPIYFPEDGNLVIASVWNIKHGLELVVKALGTIFDKQYWHDHNLEFLFSDLERKITCYSLKRDLNMLKKLVKKYGNCNFSTKTRYSDEENNYLRYPEITDTFLDYSFVHDLKRKDVNQFLKDIHNIKTVYSLLEAETVYFKSMYHLHKKDFDKRLLSVQTMKNPGYKK